MILTPGIDFIARTSFDFILPCGVAYATLILGGGYLGLDTPKWAAAVLSFALRLGYIVSKPWVEEYQNSRTARANGAVLAPRVKENHIELVQDLVRELDHGYPCETFCKLSDKYGTTFRFSVGLEERHFTSEPDHVKAILATNFEEFDKGPGLRSQLESLLGSGVFNSDGEMWKFHRSITRPFFTRDRISDFDTFDRHSKEALSMADSRLSEGYPIDFQDLAARFTLDSATEFLFKNDVRSLSAGLPYPVHPSPFTKANPPSFINHPSNIFVEAFVTSQDITAMRTQLGDLWPLSEFWKDTVGPLRKVLDGFVQPFIEKGFREKETRDGSDKSSETLLDFLVDKTSDQDVIRDELVNLLVAARDTTSSLLTFSLYMLIEHPDIEKRLRKEILDKVGYERTPTSEDIREMRYLKAFLNEVLRLYATVPLNTRTAMKPVILPPPAGSNTPLYFPANSRTIYSVFLMHRRTDLWGPDALEFDPDRFLDERVRKYLVPNPFIFCPFNAGPRICLGQQFAYNEASFFLVRLLQRFSSFTFEEKARPLDAAAPKPEWVGIPGPQGKDKIRLRNNLTMYVKGGLWIRMKEVKDGESA
ncbi:hypothetical protein D9756_005644 [Leucocoprinus leucothites]|uniref:Cytochrome P450 monooxygenase pc-3 n=1 Tax=Leucocoprinus leucothites TaxID=201217 RepID=A0A8H5D7H9_9AGAR|nr:hypothetical protein D9756_005644 [Leucoagaricus leucothites]